MSCARNEMAPSKTCCLVLQTSSVNKLHAELYCGMQLHWRQGGVVHESWGAVGRQVLHPHLWVRGAAARLLGLAFADAAICERLSPRFPLT